MSRNLFSAWRLPAGIVSADDGALERSIGSCELWGWLGGGLVIIGVLTTVAIAALHPPYDSFWERWGSAVADTLVAFGVAVEILFSRMAGLRQNELKRRSDEKVANADQVAAQAIKDAAAARERTAQIEELTAWRHIDPEMRANLLSAFAGKSDLLNLLIEYQSGDAEAFSFASEFARLFTDLGNEKIVFRPNSHLGVTIFNASIRVGECEQSSEICKACHSAFGFTPVPQDLTSCFGSGIAAPTLYMFVGPKAPPDFIFHEVYDKVKSAASDDLSPLDQA